MNLILEQLSKRFGDKVLFDSVSHTFQEGRTTCILGPSGCGKTTLLRMILGLEKPDSGKITGVPSRISTVFQEDRLCESFTPYANLRLAAPQYNHEQLDSEMARLRLTPTLQSVSTLSGGEKRRLSLIRAVLFDGDLFVLDEAFRGLDEATRILAMDYIREKIEGKTCLMVTHDLEDVEFFHADVWQL